MKDIFKKIYTKGTEDFFQEIEVSLQKNEKKFIVTANPEILMLTKKNKKIYDMLMDFNTTIVADGIGVVKANKMILSNSVERIPGVEIVSKLFQLANLHKKHIFILGSAQGVLDQLKYRLENDYPNLVVEGMINGFVSDKHAAFLEMADIQPDIILVALGVPNQEVLIYEHLNLFDKGIFVGVGGSLDVLSGNKKRAPRLFINLNLEWLYRICKEPKRIGRFYQSNIKFIFATRKEIKHNRRKL